MATPLDLRAFSLGFKSFGLPFVLLESKEIYTTMIHKLPPLSGHVMFEKPSIDWTSFQIRPILML